MTHPLHKITRRDTHNQDTRAHELRTQRHARAFEGTIVCSCVDNSVVDMRDSFCGSVHHRELLYSIVAC